MKRTNGKAHCRLCGTTRDLTRHHLIPQSLATRTITERGGWMREFIGFDSADIRHTSNVVKLCRRCHDLIERGVCLSNLRAALKTSEIMHVERVAGRDWLDSMYPTTEDVQEMAHGTGT